MQILLRARTVVLRQQLVFAENLASICAACILEGDLPLATVCGIELRRFGRGQQGVPTLREPPR